MKADISCASIGRGSPENIRGLMEGPKRLFARKPQFQPVRFDLPQCATR
jgi:hypothetical protein